MASSTFHQTVFVEIGALRVNFIIDLVGTIMLNKPDIIYVTERSENTLGRKKNKKKQHWAELTQADLEADLTSCRVDMIPISHAVLT